MTPRIRSTLVLAAFTCTALSATARAQQPGDLDEAAGGEGAPAPKEATAPPEAQTAKQQKGPKTPKRGDFNAGGQVRLPSGPDEMGEYATFNWVALDVKGQYYLLDSITANLNVPLAIIKPDTVSGGAEPSMFGGFTATLDARLPKGPFASIMRNHADVALLLVGAYMREGAMLLSEKDFPMFVGDFAPGFSTGLAMKVKLSTLVDFSLVPVWVYQAGDAESAQAVQIPMSLILAVGDAAKLSADLGVFTGDDYAFDADGGGRIYAGGALDLKIGKLIFHGGAGTASLLTGGLYPSVRDAFYLDLNVKYAK